MTCLYTGFLSTEILRLCEELAGLDYDAIKEGRSVLEIGPMMKKMIVFWRDKEIKRRRERKRNCDHVGTV